MMKKILILLGLIAAGAGGAVQAQTFETQAGDTSISIWSSGNSLKVYNRVRSTSSTPVTIQWRVTNPTTAVPSGWDLVGVCDNLSCRSTSVSLDNTWKSSGAYPGGNYDPTLSDFHVELGSMNAAPNGTAVFQIAMRDAANTSIQRNLTFIATKSAAGVVSISRSEDDVVLYPNPARGSVNVLFPAGADVRNIALYNLIGKPVMVYRPASSSSANLDLSGVPAGVYFVRLLDGQGHVVATRRFTHQ